MSSIEVDKTQPEKVSTIFLDYAEPFLDFALTDKVDPIPEDLNSIMRVPWTIWNAFYMQKYGGNVDYNNWLHELLKDIPEVFMQLIEFMIDRRENEFGHYDYMMGEYDFRIDKKTKEMRFRAEAKKMDATH